MTIGISCDFGMEYESILTTNIAVCHYQMMKSKPFFCLSLRTLESRCYGCFAVCVDNEKLMNRKT